MLAFRDVVDADPSVFAELADHWSGLADALATHHERWRAEPGTEPQDETDRVRRLFAAHESALRRVAATLQQSSVNFAAARSRVRRIRQQAARLGLVVDGDGAVLVDTNRANVTTAAVSLAAVELVGNEVTGVVRSANEADQRAAHAIQSLTPGYAEDEDLSTPESGTAPDVVARWWRGLTPQRRQHLVDGAPERIGGLDGVPCAVRDQANRTVLDARRADPRSIAGLRARLADRLLLSVDPAGTGHAVVATSDPDRAGSVVVVVPCGEQEPARALAGALAVRDSVPGAEPPSVVWWTHQDARPGATALVSDAAVALYRFMRGLVVTGVTRRTVLLGHGCGSAVLGAASRFAGWPAPDDVIVVGSPGMHVRYADELGVPAAHVWAARAVRDPVLCQRGGCGPDPTGMLFGANTFDAGHGGPRAPHDSYFRPGPALDNIGRIIAARYPEVTPEPWWERVV